MWLSPQNLLNHDVLPRPKQLRRLKQEEGQLTPALSETHGTDQGLTRTRTSTSP